MSIAKKPYEISLWEDVLTFVYEDGYVSEEKIVSGHGAVKAQYYNERKICIIGSDTMNTPLRATQGKLVSKINGENILTFNMYSHYYDENSDTYFSNPFIKLLINERKIKLRYGAIGAKDVKWYDLVIKNIQENSESKTFTYTAKDLFINELSKSGFNLEFSSELENNIGNIETLAEQILDESDWQLKPSGETLKQTVEEPLYYIQLNKQIQLKDMENDKNSIILAPGTFVYAFYNNIVNKQSFVQFLYTEKYEIDSDYYITNSPNWFLEGVTYNSEGTPDFTNTLSISDTYRGRRLVRKIKTIYDSTINKYVNVYLNGNEEVYGFTEVEYNSPATVRSYITNGSNYDSYTGWEVGGAKAGGIVKFPSLDLVSVPDVRDVPANEVIAGNINFKSCLKFKVDNTEQVLYNSGIIDHRHYINGFVEGEKYIFRAKYGKAGTLGAYGAKTLVTTGADLILTIKEYELEDGVYKTKNNNIFFQGTIKSVANNSQTYYISSGPIKCQKSLSYAEMITMTNSLGLFIQTDSNEPIYIEDIQFFPYVDNGMGGPLLPEEFSNSNIKTIYYYYKPNKNYKTIEDVNFVYKGEEPASFAEVYNGTGYEKIRSITASESNRFNLIQELCEIFECWPSFEIEHDLETGKILLDENYRQKKWVGFHEYVGRDNYVGFKYGINLKSIQRTIESEAIVSKLIVKNNANEFATDGFCSIARASESPNGENFILDFSYYIQQGLLGMSEITNDLYSDFNSFLGYYKKLRQINTKRDQYIKEQSGLIGDIAEYQANFQTYTIAASEAEKQYKDKLILIKTLTGFSFEQLMNNKANTWWTNEQVVLILSSIGRLQSVATNYKTLADKTKTSLTQAQDRYDKLNRILTDKEESEKEERLLLEKQRLHLLFYKKYSRFLQEGSWISEDYIDDNLYFLDAQSTLHTSSQPKVVYNIGVLELSQVEGYENFAFTLGDKTTIEDTEFFGWTWIDGIQTPYKEEIVVTELTIMLDSPESNQIKVQNYKTQFEDLFQRMAATTQAVEYSTGKYQKVAGIVEEDGTIDIVTLQNSIANNALILKNSNDQSVVWDETGITTTSKNDPSKLVRIVNGGIFLSNDGGISYRTGITGEGINADYITTGMLRPEKITIGNSYFSSFRWDMNGISAYEFDYNETTGQSDNYNDSKFVRLDQYGLYGIDGYSNFNPLERDQDGKIGEDKIWKHSNFALTWKGFQIKSTHTEGGYISITSNNDFQVFNSEGKEQIKIGLLYNRAKVTSRITGEEKEIPLYGLRLTDWEGYTVLEQSSDGKMWIRDELKVGSGSSTVSIGYLKDTKATKDKISVDFKDKDNSEIHQVINANNKFMVYEDGSMKATDGEFTGIIYATGGRIGNLEIEALPDPTYEVVIVSDSGAVFKEDGEKTLTAILYKGKEEITKGLTYQWYRYQYPIEGANQKTLIVRLEDLDGEQATYSCDISVDALQEEN